ncbi:MAG: prolyl-tRNA synthetase [Marteilia pararefringens]
MSRFFEASKCLPVVCSNRNVFEVAGHIKAAPCLTFLGQLLKNRLERVIRKELHASLSSCLEVYVPPIQSIKNYEISGRFSEFKDNLIGISDSHPNTHPSDKQILAPTSEESFVLLKKRLDIYGQKMPCVFYQFSEKFRREQRANNQFMRSNVFHMKEMYSFHESEACAKEHYYQVEKIYTSIFKIIFGQETPIYAVEDKESLSKRVGKSTEFHLQNVLGEDRIFHCSNCRASAKANHWKVGFETENSENFLCKSCGAENERTSLRRTSEIGHIFSFTKDFCRMIHEWKKAPKTKMDKPWLLNSYGIGVSRIISILGRNFDKFTQSIAPFDYALLSSKDYGTPECEISREMCRNFWKLLKNSPKISKLHIDLIFQDSTDRSIGFKVRDLKTIGVKNFMVFNRKIAMPDSELKNHIEFICDDKSSYMTVDEAEKYLENLC